MDNAPPAKSCVVALCCLMHAASSLSSQKDAGNGWGGPDGGSRACWTGGAGVWWGLAAATRASLRRDWRTAASTRTPADSRHERGCRGCSSACHCLPLTASDGRQEVRWKCALGQQGEGRRAECPRGACLVLPCCHVAVKHSRIEPERVPSQVGEVVGQVVQVGSHVLQTPSSTVTVHSRQSRATLCEPRAVSPAVDGAV